jgi:ECF transporter S component (folate family)
MKNDISTKARLFSTRILTRISLLIALNIILSRFLGVMLPIAGFPTIKISFSHVPLFLAGILYGPLAGFICGFVSDYIGSFISNGAGAFLPGLGFFFSISAGLVGMIPALIYKYTEKRIIDFYKINTIFILFVSACLLSIFYIKGILFSQNILVTILLFIVIIIFIFLPVMATKIFKRKNSLTSFQKIYFCINVSRIITSVFLNTFLLSILFGKGMFVFLPARILTNFIMIPMLSIATTILIDILRFQE